LRLVVLLACLLMLPAASAEAVTEPPQLVAGANSKWISGDLLQQTGLNCSTAILGSAYTEVMVAGNASYGGAPNGGVPKVNDPYWTAFLISIPGNPCGTGSSSVVTTLILPPNTQVDATRQVKCYGLPRNATDTTPWQDLTNASWSFLGQSGPYCASQPTISPYHQGGLQFGFRPLANGQLFWIFVPVKSTAELVGAAGPSPGHGFTWMTDATGVYANPGRSFVWANVFSNLGSNPFIFFSRDPAAIPFWQNDAAEGLRNRVEFFADLYSAFKPGTLCFELYAGPTATGTPIPNTHCTAVSGWNGTVTNAADLWQVFGNGPNKGYVPFAYADNTTYTLKWIFDYTGGSTSKTVTFTTLSGPDQDGDGVPNNGADACPNVKGTLANGCLPAVQEDPDKDGVYGAADNCPNTAGNGALNGCPGGIVPPPPDPPDPPKPPEPKLLVGIVQVKKGAVFKRAALAKGAPVKYTCTVDSAAAGALSIAAKVAKKLGIKPKRGQKNVVIASGKGRCDDASGGSLKLKLLRAVARKVKRARRGFPASLSVKLTAPGQTPVTMKRGVKVG
jgi:hypothetical protein